MCDPVTLAVAGFATSAIGGGVGFLGQQSQQKAQEAEYKQNTLNAQQAYADSSKAISTQQIQLQDAASQQRQQADLAARAGEATATAGAAAGGVQGVSVNELVGAYGMKDAMTKSAIDTQLNWSTAEGQQQKIAAGDQQVGRENSMTPGVPPSPIGALLGIASSGINAATGLQRQQATTGGGAPAFGYNPLAMSIPGYGNPNTGR